MAVTPARSALSVVDAEVLDLGEIARRGRALGAREVMLEGRDGAVKTYPWPGGRTDAFQRQIREELGDVLRVVYLDERQRRIEELAVAAWAEELRTLAEERTSMLVVQTVQRQLVDALDVNLKHFTSALKPAIEASAGASKGWQVGYEAQAREVKRLEAQVAHLRGALEKAREDVHALELAAVLAEGEQDPLKAQIGEAAGQLISFLGVALGEKVAE